jgi:hypothetical protein
MKLHPLLWTGSDDNHLDEGGRACRDVWQASGQ